MTQTSNNSQQKTSSPVYIFYGEDDFSLFKKVERWKEEFAKKFGASGVVVIDASTCSEADLIDKLNQVRAPSLFANKKLVIVKDGLPSKASQEEVGELILKIISDKTLTDFFVFYSSKIDKRLSVNKKILSSDANVTEFTLPHGRNLNSWIKAYGKYLGITLDEQAIEKLAVYLGRDLGEERKFGGRVVEVKEVFNLWEASSELNKLASHSNQIKATDVESLVTPKISENVFNLSDSLFRKNKRSALSLMENLFSDQSMDEKATAIKIVGLLAEQIRSLILVSLLKQQDLNNQQIADALDWTSGRVFAVSKQMGSVNFSTLKQMLGSLLDIDATLKSSDSNPKLLIDKFIVKYA